MLLPNKVAIITGAGRGIGAAAAKIFAKEGAQVVVSDRDAEPTEAVVKEIKDTGGDAMAFPGDVTDPAFPERIMEATMAAFGKLNILVNNAGYTWDAVIHKMTDEQFQAMLDVHNVAVFRLIRATVPYMRDVAKQEIEEHGEPQEDRCIINISSTSGLHGNPGQISYSCAKMGVVGITKTVAKEWGRFGIRCNAVAFGFIETRLTAAKEEGGSIEVDGQEVALGIPENMRNMAPLTIPMGRTGQPHEGAGGIVLLASPYASYISGHTLEVTGGAGI